MALAQPIHRKLTAPIGGDKKKAPKKGTTETLVGADQQKLGALLEIDVKRVKPSRANDRLDLGDIAPLAATIKQRGVLEPLIVRPMDKDYEVIAGHRRLAAAKKAGLSVVPCIVREGQDEKDVRVDRLIENVQRQDLSFLEEAIAIRFLYEDHGLNQREIGIIVGHEQSYVAKRIAILDLPDDVLKKVNAGELRVSDAFELTKLKDDPKRIEKALNSKRSYDPMSARVREQLADKERSEKRIAAMKKMRDTGVKMLNTQGPQYNLYDQSKFKPLKGQGGPAVQDRYRLPFTMAEHKNEDCHAAFVSKEGRGVHVCTDPTAHKPKGASSLKYPKDEVPTFLNGNGSNGSTGPATPKVDPAAELRAGIGAHRRKFIESLVPSLTLTAKDVLDEIMKLVLDGGLWVRQRNLITYRESPDDKDAWDLLTVLGITIPESIPDDDTLPALLRDYAAKSDGNKMRACLGALMVEAEANIYENEAMTWRSVDYTDYVAHFDLLVKYGYEISPLEKADVEGRKLSAKELKDLLKAAAE